MLRSLWLCFFVTFYSLGQAQPAIELSQFDVERSSEELSITGQLQFELSVSVEDALLRGLPIYFRADAEILKERWYWYDKSLATVSRHYKLAYQPLTRRWRVNIGTGTGASAGQGLALSQSFDSLPLAIASIKRITKWRVVGPGELDAVSRYRLDFRFQLDVSQLPRPFQIGVLGQSDWDVSIARSVSLLPDSLK